MYRIRKEIKFQAAHQIVGHIDPVTRQEGKCSRLHGHSYKIAVCVQGTNLLPIGFLMDFYWLGAQLKQIEELWDHRNLNDCPPFANQRLATTAENIAHFVYSRIADRLNLLKREGYCPDDAYVLYGECCETEGTETRFYADREEL